MHGTRDEVLANLATIRETITDACARAGRDPETVTLVGAAKTVPPEVVGWVAGAGVDAIGHNYVQELRAMHDQVPGVRWHFIGTLQASSAHHVAALADVVETVAGDKASTRLARRAREAGRVVDALIEVDLTGERGGVTPAARMTRSMEAMVSGAGRKLPGRWPRAIISGVQLHLFLRFQTLTSAP